MNKQYKKKNLKLLGVSLLSLLLCGFSYMSVLDNNNLIPLKSFDSYTDNFHAFSTRTYSQNAKVNNFQNDDAQYIETSATFSMDVSTCLEDYISPKGVEAVWSFDNTLDDEGGLHNATIESGYSFETDQDSPTGTPVLYLEGTGGIAYSNETTGFLNNSFEALTIGFWMKPENQSPNEDQVIFEQGDEETGLTIVLTSQGRLAFSLGEKGNIYDFEFPFPDSSWHHVSFSFNGSQDGIMVAYLDGEVADLLLTGESNISEHENAGGFGQVFGGESIKEGAPFKGYLDEVFFSDTTISGGALLQYNQCITGDVFVSTNNCENWAFQSIKGGWYTIDLATGISEQGFVSPVVDPSEPNIGEILNGGGYNDNNGLIYSMSRLTNGVLIITEVEDTSGTQEGKYTFTNHRVGPILGIETTNINSGDVYNNRHYIKNFTTDEIYVINLDRTSPDYLTLEKRIEIKGYNDKASDFTMKEDDLGVPYIYMVSNASSENPKLYVIDLEGNIISSETIISEDELTKFGGQFIDEDNIFYGIDNNRGKIYKIDITSSPPEAIYFSETIAGIPNDAVLCHSTRRLLPLDFGDAPASYRTVLEHDGARHFVENYNSSDHTSNLMIGSHIDTETDGNVIPSGRHDDELEIDDEDGLATESLIIKETENSQYSIDVSVTNTKGTATLYAWIDFDHTGNFEEEEYAFVTVPVSSGLQEVTLTWELPEDIEIGLTYLRLRLTTQDLDNSAANNNLDLRAYGLANDGEVEDYRVLIGCVAGAEAPSLSDRSLRLCNGATTVDLTMLSVDNFPETEDASGVELSWHTAVPVSSENQVADPTAVGAGVYYAAFIDNDSDCFSANATEVTVSNGPSLPEVSLEDVSCDSGGSITITAPLGDGLEYSIDGTNYQTDVTFHDLAAGTYTVSVREVTDPDCVSEVLENVTINSTLPETLSFTEPLPVNLFVSCEEEISETVDLTATDALGNTIEVVFSEIQKPFEDETCATGYIIEREWSASNCIGNEISHKQLLYVICPVKVYNAVSPNNDGFNDTVIMEGITCYPDNNVKIFDRWGVLVFERDNYDNNNAFRGISEGRVTVKKASKLPTGTYYYVIKYKFSLQNTTSQEFKQIGYIFINNN